MGEVLEGKGEGNERSKGVGVIVISLIYCRVIVCFGVKKRVSDFANFCLSVGVMYRFGLEREIPQMGGFFRVYIRSVGCWDTRKIAAILSVCDINATYPMRISHIKLFSACQCLLLLCLTIP